MLRGARHHRKAEARELVSARVVGGHVALVGGHDACDAALAHAADHLLVERRHAGAGVHHHNAHRRVPYGEGGLLAGLRREGVLAARRVAEGEPAGVNQQEAVAVCLHLARHAVARDARLVEHYRDAAAGYAVEESALAHVRAPHYRDHSV